MLRELFEHLVEQLRYFWINKMSVSKESMEIREMTVEEAAQALIVEDAPKSIKIVAEIPKSPCMPRNKKDNLPMILVHMSPRKLTMEEKGKVVNLETDDEEEDLEDTLIEEDEDKDMEKETECMDPLTRFPTYVPMQKGKVKVRKDIDESKSSLQTLLVPDDNTPRMGADFEVRRLGSH